MNSIFQKNKLSGLMIGVLALAAAGFGTDVLAAGTSSTNLSATATVAGTCTLATNPLAFGSYDASTAGTTSGQGAVIVTCTDGTVATVTLGEGLNPFSPNAAAPFRQMAFGTNRLGYFIYKDAAHATVWGNTIATGVTQTFTGIGGTSLIVYGSITAAQNVPVGDYVDTVVATVTF